MRESRETLAAECESSAIENAGKWLICHPGALWPSDLSELGSELLGARLFPATTSQKQKMAGGLHGGQRLE